MSHGASYSWYELFSYNSIFKWLISLTKQENFKNCDQAPDKNVGRNNDGRKFEFWLVSYAIVIMMMVILVGLLCDSDNDDGHFGWPPVR